MGKIISTVLSIILFTRICCAQVGVNIEYGLHLSGGDVRSIVADARVDYYSVGIEYKVYKDLAISIHYNSSENYWYQGINSYYSKNNDKYFLGNDSGKLKREGIDLRILKPIKWFFIEPFICVQRNNLNSDNSFSVTTGGSLGGNGGGINSFIIPTERDYDASYQFTGGINIGYFYSLTNRMKIGVNLKSELSPKPKFELSEISAFISPVSVNIDELRKVTKSNYQKMDVYFFSGIRLRYCFI